MEFLYLIYTDLNAGDGFRGVVFLPVSMHFQAFHSISAGMSI